MATLQLSRSLTPSLPLQGQSHASLLISLEFTLNPFSEGSWVSFPTWLPGKGYSYAKMWAPQAPRLPCQFSSCSARPCVPVKAKGLYGFCFFAHTYPLSPLAGTWSSVSVTVLTGEGEKMFPPVQTQILPHQSDYFNITSWLYIATVVF